MTTLAERLEAVRGRLVDACRAAGRDPEDVTLLAVSKRHPDEKVRALADLGQRDFAENLVQAWRRRRERMADVDVRWHLVGPIQSNKAKYVARDLPHLVHTIDRDSVVDALDRRIEAGRSLDVLVQVNIDEEPQKAGCDPADLDALADRVAASEALRLRGLMCIPRPPEEGTPREAFARTRGLLEGTADRLEGPPILSMGMSADFEDAILEGSTLVRVGTALFGPRPS
ncbi:MAG: YggS family pyridoxal phosphate-dependent enzyme [Myxococcota bacterium]